MKLVRAGVVGALWPRHIYVAYVNVCDSSGVWGDFRGGSLKFRLRLWGFKCRLRVDGVRVAGGKLWSHFRRTARDADKFVGEDEARLASA